MEDRYSYDKEGPARCRICGGYVHERLVSGEEALSGRTAPVVERICQNPGCPSNTGDMTISDVV
jgi:hypothetical protein